MSRDIADTGAKRGLIGGDPDIRRGQSRLPPIVHLHFLSPLTVSSDESALAEFLRHRPLFVEIGFGKGAFLVDTAAGHPEAHVLGYEVRRKLCQVALEKADRDGLTNLRVVLGDVRAHMPRFIPEGSIQAVFLMFPDPWWKTRHFKKRVLDEEFSRTLWRLLVPGGTLLVRSDVPEVLSRAEQAVDQSGGYARCEEAPFETPLTDRERSCQRRDIDTAERWFRKIDRPGGITP